MSFHTEVQDTPRIPVTRQELLYAERDLERRPTAAVLRWAAERFGPRLTLATGFGMEGCVLIDMISRHELPIDVFTLDTGLLFPETYALWRRLETRYRISIRAVRPRHSVDEQANHEGLELWNMDPDRCCELRKLQPQRVALEGFDAWISAIRRDQNAARANAKVVDWDRRFGLVKINPLVRWTAADVRAYVYAYGVPTNPLHEEGYPSIGCMPCTGPVAPGENPRAGRWRGRGKTECGLHLLPMA